MLPHSATPAARTALLRVDVSESCDVCEMSRNSKTRNKSQDVLILLELDAICCVTSITLHRSSQQYNREDFSSCIENVCNVLLLRMLMRKNRFELCYQRLTCNW